MVSFFCYDFACLFYVCEKRECRGRLNSLPRRVWSTMVSFVEVRKNSLRKEGLALFHVKGEIPKWSVSYASMVGFLVHVHLTSDHLEVYLSRRKMWKALGRPEGDVDSGLRKLERTEYLNTGSNLENSRFPHAKVTVSTLFQPTWRLSPFFSFTGTFPKAQRYIFQRFENLCGLLVHVSMLWRILCGDYSWSVSWFCCVCQMKRRLNYSQKLSICYGFIACDILGSTFYNSPDYCLVLWLPRNCLCFLS